MIHAYVNFVHVLQISLAYHINLIYSMVLFEIQRMFIIEFILIFTIFFFSINVLAKFSFFCFFSYLFSQ